MITVTGTCNFCGQTKLIELPDDTPEAIRTEEAIMEATLHCNCREGSDWRASRWVIEKCSDNIEMMFRDNMPEIADLLQEGKSIVYNGLVKRITCVTPDGGGAGNDDRPADPEAAVLDRPADDGLRRRVGNIHGTVGLRLY